MPKIGEGTALVLLIGESVIPKSVVAELVENNNNNMQTRNAVLLLACLLIVIGCSPFL
jgi:hypothetical protein